MADDIPEEVQPVKTKTERELLLAILAGSRASPFCPSGKSCIQTKKSMEHWWNGTDRGN